MFTIITTPSTYENGTLTCDKIYKVFGITLFKITYVTPM